MQAWSGDQLVILAGGPITQIYNCRVLRNHRLDYDDVWFQDGCIINPTSLYGLRSPDSRIDARGLIVAPGLVDVQLNGAFGYDFSFNTGDISACLDVVSRGILLQGCTSFCPTTVSSRPDVYHSVLPHLGQRPGSLKNGAESLGAHVEGPFMNPKKKGAHEESCLRTAPNGLADFDVCYGLDNLRNYVTYMTVAPEVEGVLDAIPQLISKCHIGVSQGHSVATNDIACQAHKNGAKMITHLFNAMTDFHHRDPGI
ncbi:N-acetyl-glucosamine-6-phosphate deacetylase, partial [Coemansia aciculifera]